MEKSLSIDGREYIIDVIVKKRLPVDAPRLVVVSHQQNDSATKLVELCLRAIRRFTSEPHEVWVVDNNSPMENVEWLKDWEDANIVFNRTDPVPPDVLGSKGSPDLMAKLQWDSYSNAIALEIAARLVDPKTMYFMSMHMDTMPCHPNWLGFLKSRLSEKVAASGVRMDTTRTPEGVLHVLGYMVNFQLFRSLNLSFLPDLPQYDVGDLVTVDLRRNGFDVFACRNTLWQPELESIISPSSPLREFHVDRSFDDKGNVIFLHLGRGVRKSLGVHNKGTTTEQWISIAEEFIIS
jgi:hypothetical protein